MAKLGKTHFDTDIAFGGVFYITVPDIAALGASVANTAIQARIPLPQRVKILKIVVNVVTAASGAATFNIVLGTGAEAGTTPGKDAVATAGQSVFASDKAITSQTADSPVIYVPDQPDALWDTGGLLTLRNTTTTSLGVQQIRLLCEAEDPLANKVQTANPSTDY